jgi:hypothetical protein
MWKEVLVVYYKVDPLMIPELLKKGLKKITQTSVRMAGLRA